MPTIGSDIFYPPGSGGGGSNYDPAAVAITGGTINGTPIGGTTPSTGAFTIINLSDAHDAAFLQSDSQLTQIGGYQGVSFTWQFGELAKITGAGLLLNGNALLSGPAANTLALRNGANGQVFQVYGTYTDDSNYERAYIGRLGSNFAIQIEQAGTGTARSLQFLTTGGAPIEFYTGASHRWDISSSGHFLAAGAYNIVTTGTVQGKLTTDAAATTGLTAGVLSALTTASIVIYDSTGTAYRVPCITP